MTPHPTRRARILGPVFASLACLLAAAPALAGWTPLADSADQALGWAGRRAMGEHAQAVRDHIDRTPSGVWNAAGAPRVETFPSLDPGHYFSTRPAVGLLDADGLTDRGRVVLGRGDRLGLDPVEARRWSTAACRGNEDCSHALREVLADTASAGTGGARRLAPHDLERHFLNSAATTQAGVPTRRAQRAAVRALYRLTVEAAFAAGHLDPDIRGRVLGALETRADLPWWPSSATVLTLEAPRRASAGPRGGGEEGEDPVLLAQAVTTTANGVMDDRLPQIDPLGETTLTLAAGGQWRDSDWSEIGYGGDMATFSMVASRPLSDVVTIGVASTWEFPGMEDGGWGTTGSGTTIGPFLHLSLGDGLSAHVMGTASRFDSDVASWDGEGEGHFNGERLGAVTGLSYGASDGAWDWGGTAEATWFTQTRNAFTDSAGRHNPAAGLELVQLQLGGHLSYAGDLAALSPRLEGSFAPWAAADAVATGQASTSAADLTAPDPVRGRVRLGLDITPDGGPALSLQGGASRLGAGKPGYDARAGLKLRF